MCNIPILRKNTEPLVSDLSVEKINSAYKKDSFFRITLTRRSPFTQWATLDTPEPASLKPFLQ